MNKKEFLNECKMININLSNEMLIKFEKYYNLLVEYNKKFNLTTILEEKDVYLKHFYDSLCLIKGCNLYESLKICDFGTGAGFPGVVLAIVFENLNIDLIESNNKKISFLEVVKNELDLKKVRIINARVEEYARNNRELYDIVTCRAVSNLGIIGEEAISLIKVNGFFLPLKSNVQEEINTYLPTLEKMGYKNENTIEYHLPISDAYRCIVVMKKLKKTSSNIPRSYNEIVKTYR